MRMGEKMANQRDQALADRMLYDSVPKIKAEAAKAHTAGEAIASFGFLIVHKERKRGWSAE